MTQQCNASYKSGFTIIELLLAMSFVTGLLLAIAMLTIYIGGIYNRGITLRDVNQAGQSIAEDLQRTIGSTAPFSLDEEAVSPKYRSIDGRGGRLCVGRYSYLWNVTVLPPAVPNALNKFEGPNQDTPIHLAKVNDFDASLCSDLSENPKFEDATDLLQAGDRNLVLYDFSITTGTPPNQNAVQALYGIDFLIGTGNTEAIEGSGRDATCRPPADAKSDIEYCAVNQFSIVARAGNEVGGS